MARPTLVCLLAVFTLAGCSHPGSIPASPEAQSFVGTWSSDVFKDDLVTLTMRPDNSFSFIESKDHGGLIVGRFDGTWSREGKFVKLHSLRSALIGGDPNVFRPQRGMEISFSMTTAGDIGLLQAGGGTGVSLRVGTVSYPLVASPTKEIARDLSPDEKQFDETINPNKKNLPNGSPAYSQTVISSAPGDQTRRAYVDAPPAGQAANQGSEQPRSIEYGSTSGDTAGNPPPDSTAATGTENPPQASGSGTTTGDNTNGSTDSSSGGDNGSTGANGTGF